MAQKKTTKQPTKTTVSRMPEQLIERKILQIRGQKVMLSSVLNSDRAIDVNVQIIQAFVKLREMLGSHKELAQKLAAMENKYDDHFKVVFDAIRQLMEPPPVSKKRPIGFQVPRKDDEE